MKKALYILAFAVVSVAVISSCQKGDSPTPTPPQEKRLTGYSVVTTDTVNYSVHYNSDNKIASITYKYSTGASTTLFDVQYVRNEIFLTRDFPSPGGGTVFDTIHLFVSTDNKTAMRVRHFIEKDTGSHGLMQYSIDTIWNQYDAAGLLQSQTDRYFDSAYDLSRRTTVFKVRYVTIANYTNSNAVLVSMNQTTHDTTHTFNYNTGILSSRRTSDEASVILNYNKGYANKTDFSNELVFDEARALTTDFPPMNKLYRQLPDKLSYSTVSKDSSGIVISSSNYDENNEYSYDSTGIITGRNWTSTRQNTFPSKTTFYYQ